MLLPTPGGISTMNVCPSEELKTGNVLRLAVALPCVDPCDIMLLQLSFSVEEELGAVLARRGKCPIRCLA